ncbi:MAG: glycosyltransferase family 4 protein [Dehalococcoidales bacterium]|nr:glycosyltransferase family 4 protein [Dehalococcoidales bacterium]
MNILVFLPTHTLKIDRGDTIHIKELVGNLSKLAKTDVIIASDFVASIKVPFMTTILRVIPGITRAASLIRKRRPDIIYVRSTEAIFAIVLAKFFRIPLIVEINNFFIDEWRMTTKNSGMRKWVSYILGSLNEKTFKYANHLVVVAPEIKEELELKYKIKPEKITVIGNGANTELFSPMNTGEAREKLKLNHADNYICFIGNLIHWQGVEYLIEASPYILEEYPNTLFLIVGDGPIRNPLTELAQGLGVSDRFVFTGTVPYDKVPLYMNSSDICVIPKRPIKTSPLKLYEYMACGRPVIGSDIEGVREIIIESKAGICVPPENSRELAKAAIDLLRDPGSRESMGKNGRSYIVENRSWESVARKVFGVCQMVVKNTDRNAAKRESSMESNPTGKESL